MGTMHARNMVVAMTVALSLTAFGNAAGAETREVRIADQFGLSYLPVYVALSEQMFRKRFDAAGLRDVKVTELKIASGSAANDALLSENADLVLGAPANR